MPTSQIFCSECKTAFLSFLSEMVRVMFCGTHRVLEFPFRCDEEVRFLATDLYPVALFSCDSWLALVRGNRGDPPVPGRTGGVPATKHSALLQNTNH